jgi:Gtr1/RagA G protein conserved region
VIIQNRRLAISGGILATDLSLPPQSQNTLPSLTSRLGATIEVEQSHQRFLGSLVLNLWDCAGQSSFLESYIAGQKSTIFAHVGVLIYVFDVETSSHDWMSDLKYFRECLKALLDYSPDAAAFVLVHKMVTASKSVGISLAHATTGPYLCFGACQRFRRKTTSVATTLRRRYQGISRVRD